MNATETRTTTAGISIVPSGSTVKVKSPYLPEFIAIARQMNGKWSSPHWVFDARDEARLRDECRKLYGTDGTEVPTVDCRVDLDVFPCRGPAYYGLGRMLVERKERDYSARLGEGVVVVSGGFPKSGGSVKNPRPDEEGGTVLEVRDVPIDLARRVAFECAGITILGMDGEGPTEAPTARDAAIAEIRKLMAEYAVSIDELS